MAKNKLNSEAIDKNATEKKNRLTKLTTVMTSLKVEMMKKELCQQILMKFIVDTKNILMLKMLELPMIITETLLI